MLNKTPTEVKLRRQSNTLELSYSDGSQLEFSSEFLRVHSPSAEVRGHGKGQEVLQTGKRLVKLKNVEPVGNYAVKLEFDDGHNTGIFSWDYLISIGRDKKTLWDDYLLKLQQAGKTRDPSPPDMQIIEIKPLKN
ncbi:MAG: 1-(5-phosphoribosyl)-5-((5-phosphoribosylamino)methylideneamino)imidazole-4-carboxamide isomerase [Gammaproteobacteria bacterium]|nr:1-(5-phosphoribosyl)-5-((5-phosphoribosylamino)methylideneamino)imidazole-4-carboxamide isomerase [Gammaproteobacteria bacterium]|tara:strand:- start:2016 stop:2420 length:405 start_codon:yes stop_codon:yes gene_type:complete